MARSVAAGWLAWPVAVVLAIAGATPAAAGDGGILVAAAVSLRRPLADIARGFEMEHPSTPVALTFGSSGALAAQIRAGAPVDVLVAADERIVAELARGADVDTATQRALAGNRLVVLATPAIASAIAEPRDLLAPAIARIAVAVESAPLGAYSRAWLREARLLAAVGDRIVPTPHARATLAAVENGSADVAIVYATDARLARAARLAFRVPAAEHPAIRYAAVRVSASRRPEAAARFLDFLGSEVAQDALRDAGFEIP